MSEIVFTVEPEPNGGYQAYCLEEGILTHADTLAELNEMIQQVLEHQYSPDKPAVPIRIIMGTQETRIDHQHVV